MKFRIVKTESDHYRIQRAYFFGLLWKFYAEPTVYFSYYNAHFEVDDNEFAYYKTQEEAEKAIQALKSTPLWYKGHYIDAYKHQGYYKYFISKGRFHNLTYKHSYDTIEEAKAKIDEDTEEENNELKKEKVEKVLKYY